MKDNFCANLMRAKASLRGGAVAGALSAALLAPVAAGSAAAEAKDAAAIVPRESDATVSDFRFQSGETLPQLRLHYLTLGEPQRDGGGRVVNAVLLLHGTTGTAKSFLVPGIAGELFGPGQPLDASRYYIVIPDGLGRGGSTKPSDGLRARFPKYGYADVVEAQHRLLHDELGIDRLRLVLGVSMGGMQTWMWAERYPGMVEAAMPIACQPMQISGRNLVFRRILSEAIRHDPDWNDGNYTAPPSHWVYAAPLWPVILDSAVHLQAEAPTRQAAVAAYDRMVEAARKIDANDFLYWLESSWDYDPQPALDRIKARVVAVNFGDDVINAADLAEARALVESVPTARFVLIPESDRTAGHQTLARAAVWKSYLQQLMDETAPR